MQKPCKYYGVFKIEVKKENRINKIEYTKRDGVNKPTRYQCSNRQTHIYRVDSLIKKTLHQIFGYFVAAALIGLEGKPIHFIYFAIWVQKQ